MRAQPAYQELIQRTKEAALLASCLELIGWDEFTYMPRAGGAHRANQVALLTGRYHAQVTDPRISELLGALEGSDLVRDPLSVEAVNVRDIRRLTQRQRRLPRHLVEEQAWVTCQAQSEWEIARRNSDFPRFRPWLEKVVALKANEAEALGYAATPYDALLEEYDSGTRSADIARLFAALQPELVSLTSALAETPRQAVNLRGEFPVERQQLLCEMVAAAIGFDFQAGRLDTAVHPFTSAIGPGDCRLTVRYLPDRFTDALFTTLH
jgi:carboxypeptidase Taq